MPNKHSLVRTIYLYLFALIGLVLLIIGAVNFIDMGLKAYVFTKADDQEKIYGVRPPAPYNLEKIEDLAESEGATELTEQERALIRDWLVEYEEWQDEESRIDTVVSGRHREASNNLAMIIVGLPLFLYHWGIIKREIRNKKKS